MRIGKWLIDCYLDSFGLSVKRNVTDVRLQLGWLVIDLTDMSVDVEEFLENWK